MQEKKDKKTDDVTSYVPSNKVSYSPPVLRVAAIHDLSGFGRSSLTTIIPTLSTMGMQVCPLPTAVLSSQTAGVTDFTFFDLTQQMGEMLNHWQKVNMSFDAVYSGFLGSARQIELVEKCVRNHIKEQSIFIVDPVLGDDGELYPTQTKEMVNAMRDLASLADIITPNFTEACLLLGEEYQKNVKTEVLKEYLVRLSNLHSEPKERDFDNKRYIAQSDENIKRQKHSKTVIITGVSLEDEDPNKLDETDAYLRVVIYEEATKRFWQVKNHRVPVSYPGTGDIFASVLLGSLLQKDSIPIAVARATQFVYEAILVTYGYNLPEYEGVLLERILPSLRKQGIFEYEVF